MTTEREPLFPLERALLALYDVVCPFYGKDTHPSGRGIKPLICEALGVTVGEGDSRVLHQRRKYYKFDPEDFLDFATSELGSMPVLGEFEFNTLAFYEGIGGVPAVPLLTKDSERGLSLVDCVIARRDPFVSVTARFIRQVKDASTGQWRHPEKWEEGGAWRGITIILVPEKPGKHAPTVRAKAPLALTWYEGAFEPPCLEDAEWRFWQNGDYVDFVLAESERTQDGTVDDRIAAQIREGRARLLSENAEELALARLCFALPAYFRFMVDLVETDHIPIVKDHGSAVQARGKARKAADSDIQYRVVRSVRILRPVTEDTDTSSRRAYSPPSYAFGVRGHWRVYEDSTTKGSDGLGNVVFGRTWVRDYVKGMGREEFAAGLAPVVVEPKTIIYVKQSVAYAKQLVAATAVKDRSTLATSVTRGPDVIKKRDASDVPSVEWKANERRKLTAALRYLILRRDGFRCCLCGASQADDPGIRLEVDHKLPVANWGQTIESNLWTLCRGCNGGKSARGLTH